MSTTAPHEAASTTDDPLANLLFDYPGADIIIRSPDSSHFVVPKIYIINSSPTLGELIGRILDYPGDSNTDASLPVVQLPESGEVLHCLLTFVFPVTPLVPSTHEEIMELLSVAQKYQMGSVLIHIRDRIAQHHPLPTRLEPALHIYALAQKYGLRPEALRAARIILNYPMTIEVFDDKLETIPGAYLYELWTYHESVRAFLVSDLTEFMKSGAHDTITGLRCTGLGSSQTPSWLDDYVESIGKTPNLFNFTELNIAMARHIKDGPNSIGCKCAFIPSQTILDFWEALASVVRGSFERVGTINISSCVGY
jgi:hypothetical protein